jgi:CRP/FNR family transcriptional regulator, cyclic AMP receptor protein
MDEPSRVEGTLHLRDEDLAALLTLGQMMPARPQGYVFFSEGEQTDYALLILEGHVRVTVGTPHRTIAIRHPGELVGEMAAIRKRPRSASVIAFDEVRALFLPAAKWLQFLDEHRSAIYALLIASEERTEQATRKIGDSDLAVEQRVAKALAELAKEGLGIHTEEGIGLRLGQADLASWIGTSKLDSVKKVIRTFKDAGLISTGRQVITILDPSAIRDIANGDLTASAWSQQGMRNVRPPA